MKWFVSFFVIIFLLAAVLPLSAEIIGRTEESVQAIAEPILDNILDGFAKNDYAKYTKDFDMTLKESISEQKFIQTRQQILDWIGNYQIREFLGFLNRGKMTVVIWKGIFDKSKEDVLIKLVVSERKGQYFVTGLWFE